MITSEKEQKQSESALVSEIFEHQHGPMTNEKPGKGSGPDLEGQAQVTPHLNNLPIAGLNMLECPSEGVELDSNAEHAKSNESSLVEAQRKQNHLAQLSPISEMYKRMDGVSLKRQADEPTSPGILNKRSLFCEEGEAPAVSPRPRDVSRLKNVRKVKKEIRGQVSRAEEGTRVGPEVGEIDFPVEWMVPSGLDGKDEVCATRSEGSGGCPTTATKEP